MQVSAATTGQRIELAGEEVHLLAERAVWWPARRTLLVADLHIGKEETFRRAGIAMPQAVLDETLGRLGLITAVTGAERLVVIGDLIHGRVGLSDAVVGQFGRWRESFPGRIELVVGNHDRHVKAMPTEWRIEVRDEEEGDGPFRYRHEPRESSQPGLEFEWSGHLHPTVRLAGVAMPAFVVSSRAAILPAFTSFSRGPGFWPCEARRIFCVADGTVIEMG